MARMTFDSEPPHFRLERHGLHYIDRDEQTTFQLDREFVPSIPRPERDVVIALLRWAADQLERQNDTIEERA